jgi:radical SAM protein (TIGR01212 family)
LTRRYLAVSEAWRARFGGRVQRIPVAVEAGCPVRDGTLGRGGCAFCAEDALSLRWLDQRGPVREQLLRGLAAVRRRFGASLGMAYFQNHTATWRSADALARDLDEALSVEGIVGVAVGARPDALAPDVLEVLAAAARRGHVEVELGLQSAREATLVEMGRGHGVTATRTACARVKAAGLALTAHVIVGWPGEDRDDWRRTLDLVNELGADGVKLHNLHVLRGTPLAARYEREAFPLLSRDAWLDALCGLLPHLDARVVVHRVVAEALPEHLVAPEWMRAPSGFREALDARLEERDIWQGRRPA